MSRRRVVGLLALGVGTIAAVLAALAIYGATQPREHEAARTIELALAPDEVFAILEDSDAFPCWRTGVTAVESLPGTPRRFVEHTDDGTITYVVDERVPGRRLVVRIADDDLPWGGTWTYELAPRQGGTALTITERGFIDSVFLRGIAGLLMDPTASMTQVQQDLLHHRRCPRTGAARDPDLDTAE